MEIITSVRTAISLVKKLREISKNIKEAEFKNLLADLASELADVKLEAASLKEKIAELSEENSQLRRIKQSDGERPKGTKWGCYIFEGDESLYCTACWDTKKQKILTTRATIKYRMCPVCKATFG